MSTLGIGIIGAGGIARQHGIAWSTFPDRATITAIADVSSERAESFANQFHCENAELHASFESLIADPNVDAVDICLPHHLHTPAILAAARAGKAIFCEKPLCTSFDDARAIGAAISESGVTFVMAHNQLFQPSLVEARKLLALGAVGTPYLIRSIECFQHRDLWLGNTGHNLGTGESPWAWRADPAKMGGGEILDTGWHSTYRLLALANDRPTEVIAMTERFLIPDLPTEDSGMLTIKFASGAIGQIITSWAFSTIDNWHFEVNAQSGNLAGNNDRIVHQLHRWPEPSVQKVTPVHTFTEEAKHFLDVVDGTVPNMATFEQGCRALQITFGAYLSIKEKRTAFLPEDPLADPYVQ